MRAAARGPRRPHSSQLHQHSTEGQGSSGTDVSRIKRSWTSPPPRRGEDFLYTLKAGPAGGRRGTGLTHSKDGARAATSAPLFCGAGCSKLAGLGGRKPPVSWIITLLLILAAAVAVGLRIEALTWRDKPAEPSLAQRWKAMGGG